MPTMLRPSGKAKKIAYRILGKPANLKRKPKTKVNKRLEYEDSRLSR